MGAAAVSRTSIPIEPPEREELPPLRGLGRQRASPGCASIGRTPPTRPFFMYWAPGAAHGPHHVVKEWADKYKGKFDDGWDAYRERVFARQKATGMDTRRGGADAARRHAWQGWDGHSRGAAAVPAAIDGGVRRLPRARRRPGRQDPRRTGATRASRDNTIVIYIFGDNGSSAEGQSGSISELLAQNGIPTTVEQADWPRSRRSAVWRRWARRRPTTCTSRLGLGRQYAVPATPSWSPHFGGTRNPMVDLLAASRITPDG